MFKHLYRTGLLVLGLGLSAAAAAQAGKEPPRVHFLNWTEYIAADTLPAFTRQTGISVTYDVFDSNEVLEARLLAGNTGFDIVTPSADFMGRQIKAGAFRKLDKSRIPNYKELDPHIMRQLQAHDPGNQYGIPYMWGTTGIGYNIDKVREILGEDAPVDSWELILKPENIEKLSRCGVVFEDDPTEIFAITLNYLGQNPKSTKAADYDVDGQAVQLLMKLRPHITYFHSSRFIQDLANGNICVVVGWSGDILQAAQKASEADKGVHIAYSIPKEGTVMWFDMLAIPKDARHVDNAHRLINHLLEPEVAAANTNEVANANPIPASLAWVEEEVRDNPGIYPPPQVMEKLFALSAHGAAVNRTITRNWTRIRTGI